MYFYFHGMSYMYDSYTFCSFRKHFIRAMTGSQIKLIEIFSLSLFFRLKLYVCRHLNFGKHKLASFHQNVMIHMCKSVEN